VSHPSVDILTLPDAVLSERDTEAIADFLATVLGGPLLEVLDERARQDAKWGEQNHPDIAPHIVAPGQVPFVHGLPSAADAKRMTDSRAKAGLVSWADIAIEELAEALEAAALDDEDAVRNEVVQLASVCVQWVQAIDRRKANR
jgi:hypothetical protein